MKEGGKKETKKTNVGLNERKKQKQKRKNDKERDEQK